MNKLVVLASLLACTSPDPIRPPAAPVGFVVHEWGTFTSVEGSDGVPLLGLQHEEEPLPSFVHTRSDKYYLGGQGKGLDGFSYQWSGVTQKLETPVLYFHNAGFLSVQVNVRFPLGVISQWYPQSTSFLPAIASTAPPTPSKPALLPVEGGSMTWRGDLVADRKGLVVIDPRIDDVWMPSRTVAANPIRVNVENQSVEKENFIFYRGVGAFDVGFHVRSEADGTLAVLNDSDQRIAAAFLVRVDEEGFVGAFSSIGAVAPHGSAKVAVPDVSGDTNIFEHTRRAADGVAAALIASGLYADEARAMVETWSRSYFRLRGLRVLYVAPREWTDALLPLSIIPTPDGLVRTLVGRIEVTTRADESSILAMVKADYDASIGPPPVNPGPTVLARLGRFAEPRLRRVCPMVKDDAMRLFCEGQITASASAF